MRTVKWILAGCFFTASFDTILLINVGGMIRISQMLLGLVCVAAAARVIQDGRILWPRGGASIAAWLFSQLLFLPLSGVIPIGINFLALITLTVVGFFAVIQLYGRSLSLEQLMRIYLLSYVFVGLFGLLQFTTPLVGLPPIMVQQWLRYGKLARISGFSYEPSYFGTYMMMGWIMLVELRINGAKIASGRWWKWATIALTVSLICSSSRTAWAIMLVELVARVVPRVWNAMRGAVRQMAQGRAVVRLRGRLILNTTLAIVVFAIAATYITRLIDPIMLLSGTGLANTAAHSTNTRLGDAGTTFDAFLEHPFIGRSLGGVPIYRAQRIGVEVHTMEELRDYWGFPVFFEVLVASGIFGAAFFLHFVYVNTFGALKLARQRWPSERAKWLRALARAMIFECLILLTDQNLLRVYVWFHVTMVAVVAYNLEFGGEAEAVAVPHTPPMLEGIAAA